MNRKMSFAHVMLTAASLLLLPAAAFAEVSPNSAGPDAAVESEGWMDDVVPDQPHPPSYGTAGLIVYSVPAHQFHPIDSTVTYGYSTVGGSLSIHRTNSVGNPWLEAPIHLPTGALINTVEFHLCDSSDTFQFYSFLTIHSKDGSIQQPSLVSTSGAEAPGCILRSFTFGTPVQVNNNTTAYSIEVNLGGSGTTPGTAIKIASARVYYKLQISPAPATATFIDVSTVHPFFQHIEALAASGITSGYPDGTFRPDDPVTRKQMAAFLARALGLHWPN